MSSIFIALNALTYDSARFFLPVVGSLTNSFIPHTHRLGNLFASLPILERTNRWKHNVAVTSDLKGAHL